VSSPHRLIGSTPQGFLGTVKTRALTRLAVRDNVVVGPKFHVGPGSVLWAPSSLVVGNNVYVGKHVTIEVDGIIGDEVLIANNVGIVGRRDHDHRQIGVPIRSADWVGDCRHLSDNTVIGSDVWIGFGAIVLSGVRIGNSSVIAAGSIVTTNVPDNTIVAGVPASPVGRRMDEAEFAEHWRRLKTSGVRWIEA
jgi:acetyltransferase-like isoleucine patch superfamily enzyme